jgi:hypothetical protein
MSRIRRAILAAIIAAAALHLRPATSVAADFTVEDHAQLGAKIVRLKGEIVKGDDERLWAALESLKGTRLTDVYVALESDGGLNREGLAMARRLRRLGIGTMVMPGARCASACMFVFFGGYDSKSRRPRRIAFQGAKLGVHRSRIELKPDEAKVRWKGDFAKVYTALQIAVGNLLVELNSLDVSVDVQRRLLTTDHTAIYFLSDADKKGSQITLVRGRPGRWVVDPRICPHRRCRPAWPILTQEAKAPLGAAAPASTPVATVRRYAGDLRAVDVTWTRSFQCFLAAAREINLKVELCPGSDGLAADVGFQDGTFAAFSDWVPEFAGSNAIKLRDSDGHAGLLKLRVVAANRARVLVVTSPWVQEVSSLGPPREIALDLDAVGITLSLPPDIAEALWIAVLEQKPSQQF